MRAHFLAAAILDYQTGSGRLAADLPNLGEFLAGDNAAVPGSFEQVCTLVDEIEGVHMAKLLSGLPRRAPDGATAMAEVLRLAEVLVAEARAGHRLQLLADWEPVLSALVTAHHPATDPDTRAAAATALDAFLAARSGPPDWQALVAVLLTTALDAAIAASPSPWMLT